MVSSKPKDRLTPAFEIRPRGFEPLAFGSGEDGTKGSLRFLKGFGSSENQKNGQGRSRRGSATQMLSKEALNLPTSKPLFGGKIVNYPISLLASFACEDWGRRR